MTSRRKVEHQRRSLAEIREIMNSMKTLAYMETRKLTPRLDAQCSVRSNIESVAADFASFVPTLLTPQEPRRYAYVLIGSERGFCGDFNESLIRHMDGIEKHHARGTGAAVVAIGHKLCTRLADDKRVDAFLDGAGVAEEAGAVMSRIVAALDEMQGRYGTLVVHALYHAVGEQDVVERQLLPAFQQPVTATPEFGIPPILNLEPNQLLLELLDHYLFAVLDEIICASLMAENHRRAQHLEGAIRHLDEESGELKRRSDALRQEEIIEEIEVILLSATSFSGTQLRQ